MGGTDPTTATFSYYTTQDDANNAVNAISNILTVDSSLSEVFFRADFVGSTCFSTTSLVINTGAVPVITSPADIFECSATGSATVDLTTVETELLTGLNPVDYTVTYHTTQLDADSNSNAVTADAYIVSSSSEEVFVRVENSSGCFATQSFLVGVTPAPTIGVLGPLSICDDGSGTYVFDLTRASDDIYGSLAQADYYISYFQELSDAETQTNPILQPALYEPADLSLPVFARLTRVGDSNCYATVGFDLELFDEINLGTINPIFECSSTGSSTIDLTQVETELLSGTDPTGLSVSYHASQTDADSNANALNAPTYAISVPSENIFVRVTNANGCYATTSFQVGSYNSTEYRNITAIGSMSG